MRFSRPLATTGLATAMQAADLRTRFLHFFAERSQTIVASSSLVPANDPTLLFVNSYASASQSRSNGEELRANRAAVGAS